MLVKYQNDTKLKLNTRDEKNKDIYKAVLVFFEV